MTSFSRRDAIKTGGLLTLSLIASGCGGSSTPLVSPAAAQVDDGAIPTVTPKTEGVYLQRGNQSTLEPLGDQRYRLVIGDLVSSHFAESHPSTGARFGFESIDSFLAAYSTRFSGYNPVAVLEYSDSTGRLLAFPLQLENPTRVANGLSYVVTPTRSAPAGYSSLNEAVVTSFPDTIRQQSSGPTSLGEAHLNITTQAASSANSEIDFEIVRVSSLALESQGTWDLSSGSGTLRVFADAAETRFLFFRIPSIVDRGDPFTWIVTHKGQVYRYASTEGFQFEPFKSSDVLGLAVDSRGSDTLPVYVPASLSVAFSDPSHTDETAPIQIILRDA